MGLKEDFERATEEVKTLPRKPSDSDLLELYALFKQASAGDVQGSRPGMLDFVGRKKFDSWATKKGTPSEAAMSAYIALVAKLKSAS